MPRSYRKMEELAAAVLERKAAGESNQQIAESYGLSRRQIEQLVNRQNRKRRKLEAGITIRPKVRASVLKHQKQRRSRRFIICG